MPGISRYLAALSNVQCQLIPQLSFDGNYGHHPNAARDTCSRKVVLVQGCLQIRPRRELFPCHIVHCSVFRRLSLHQRIRGNEYRQLWGGKGIHFHTRQLIHVVLTVISSVPYALEYRSWNCERFRMWFRDQVTRVGEDFRRSAFATDVN